jgi:predicted permease
MDLLRILISRCVALFRRRKLDADLDEELRSHIDLAVEENLEPGMSEQEVLTAALRGFGGVTQVKEAYRTERGLPWLGTLAQDVRYASRQVQESPGFALSTVLTLALGIGTATAMFTIVYGVLLQPLPFPDARQLYEPIGIDAKGNEDFGASYPNIERWREATHETAEIGFSTENLGILDAPLGAQLVSNIATSANLLPLLGVQPILGRIFDPQEQEDGKSRVVLFSFALWRQAFWEDPNILGKVVHIGGLPYTVIGVMAPQFEFPLYDTRPQVWTPLERSKLMLADIPGSYATFHPILRVRRGSQAAAVQALLTSAQERIAGPAGLGEEVATRVRLGGLHDDLVADARPALTALEVAVALVWLIACCNVAGLLLARIAARRMEIAVRSALGAGRPRIVCQFLTESLVLSSAGALAGLGLAMLMLQLFRHMLERTLPLAQNIHLSWPIYAALIGLTLITGLAFGTFPAAIAAHSPMDQGLKYGGRTASADRGQTRLRSILVISEIALAVVLLDSAGLMLRTMYAIRHVPLGFQIDHIVMTDITLPSYLYKDRNLNAAWRPLLDRVQRLPGVQSVALSTVMPIGHPVELLTVVYSTAWTNGNVSAAVRAASPDLMSVLGIQMRAGRFFTNQDTQNSLPVAVVNQAFVERYLGGRDPLGERIQFGRIPSTATIVGVLEDIHQDAVTVPSQPEFYLCMAQLQPSSPLYIPLIGRYMQLAVRTQNLPDMMIQELRSAITQENPSLALGSFTTMNQAVEDSIGSQRLAAHVIAVFGGLALLITIVGLYGLLSYSVAQRTQEICIRMALGADRIRVMMMVMRQALALLAVGAIAGMVLAFWSSRLLNSLLYGVKRYDPWTLVLVLAVLIIISIFAVFIPARRAASIDPMRALRAD